MRTTQIEQRARMLAALDPRERESALAAGLARHDGCPVTRYAAACHALDRGRVATAVRHFMVASHREPQFRSAALLVFAGLSWIERLDEPLLNVLLETWEEFRRPEFDTLPRERALLTAWSEPEPDLDQVSPLARRLWRLPIRGLRAQIRDVAARPEHAPPALLIPAI